MKPMSDSEIRKFARVFTKGLLGKRETNMMCFMVSAPLAGYLGAVGIKCEVVEGEVGSMSNHWWIQFPDGRIIDATASQFGLKNVWLRHSDSHKKYASQSTDEQFPVAWDSTEINTVSAKPILGAAQAT